MILSSNGRIVISDIEQSGPLRYESNLTIGTLSIQDSGKYSCEVTIDHQPTSPFIAGNTGSATTVIIVKGWGASVCIYAQNISVAKQLSSPLQCI